MSRQWILATAGALAALGTLGATGVVRADPIAYTGVPPRALVLPIPGPGIPPPPAVSGKEYSNGNCEAPTVGGCPPPAGGGTPVDGDVNAAGVFTPGQTVRWDGLGGTTDTKLFTGDGLTPPPPPQGWQVDAIANMGDVLFGSVTSNRSALLFSTDMDARIFVEAIGGGGGIWALPGSIHASANDPGPHVTDVDALEVWGSDSSDDSTHYSLESGTTTGSIDPGGVAVWANVSAGPDVPLLTDFAIAGALAPLTGIDIGILEQNIDLDAMMLDVASETILFSVDPVLDVTGATLLDGGEIFVWNYGGPGPATYLVHGGHTWDTAFNVMGTFRTETENINALEAISIPEPASLALLGLALAAMGWRRRRC